MDRFLGMLTFITFVILGISGALLMFYYEPILDRAWDSVEFINNDVPFGFHIRNIHYHGSNAMVLLAILHMYYQYFSGRYKIRNEILWVTGVILGTVTILEAFTGYDIIFSERAELAISIAASLTNSIPVVGSLIRETMFGNGFHDFVLRFYAALFSSDSFAKCHSEFCTNNTQLVYGLRVQAMYLLECKIPNIWLP